MSLGISLSQLIVENPKPVLSGIETLDYALEGFQTRSIYEIYGPPGVGKTKLGLQMLNNELKRGNSCLWIDTHKFTPLKLSNGGESLRRIKITKFSHLVFFFQEIEEDYSLIIIDGLSQLLTDYLYANLQISKTGSIHNFKNKNLITLFTLMTKYTHAKKATIVLLNDAMNTSYQDNADDRMTSYKDESRFLVRSLKRRSVQVLKSGLIANVGIGSKDHLWEVFLKYRIGLFWNWDTRKPFKGCPPKTRIAVLFDLNKRSDSEENTIIRFTVDKESGNFISVDHPETDFPYDVPRSFSPVGPPLSGLSTSTLNEDQSFFNQDEPDELDGREDDSELLPTDLSNKRHKINIPCTPRLREMMSVEPVSKQLDPTIYDVN